MKQDIDRLRGRCDIFFNGHYVVVQGKTLRIFHTDGSCIAWRKDLLYSGRTTFLSGDRMLISSKSVVHMVDLQSGEDLWTVPLPKTETDLYHFALTPDESCAYTYDHWDGRLLMIRLDLNEREVDSYGVFYDSGATWDIICDEEGIPCVLKSEYENIGGKEFSLNGIRIQDYDILYRGSSSYWKSKWQFDMNRVAKYFLGSIDRIVTSDLHIYEPSPVPTPICWNRILNSRISYLQDFGQIPPDVTCVSVISPEMWS